MPTFQELYCAKHGCSPEQFHRRVFRHCLYPHARPIAPLIRLLNYDFFAADRTLLLSVAEAVSMKRVREEVRDYFWDSNNRGWMREALRIRMSGQRLKDLARQYLPESSSVPPFPPRESSASSPPS